MNGPVVNYTTAYGARAPVGVSIATLSQDNTTAAATANTAAIQAALNGKGLVQITTPGTYQIAASNAATADRILSMPSDTTLYLGPGVVLQGPSNSSGTPVIPLIVNSNWRSNKVSVTSITCSTSSAPYVTTATLTATAHGYAVGDYILIKGDTTGYYNGVWKVLTVPTANTLTFQMYEFGSNPPSAAGTLIAYAANANFRVVGEGTFDGNNNSTNTGYLGDLGKFGSIWNKVADYEISCNFRNTAKYGIQCCNSYRSTFKPGTFQTISDGVHINGPFQNGRVEGFYGSTGDDCIALTTTNNGGFSAYDMRDSDAGTYAACTKNSDGDINDLDIVNAQFAASVSRMFLLAASGGFAVRRVTVRGCKRMNSLSGIYGLLDGVAGDTGYYEDILIDGLHGNYASGISPVVVGTTSTAIQNVKGLTVRNVGSHGGDVSGSPAAMTAPVVLFSNATTTVQGLTIENCDILYDQTPSISPNILSFGAGGGVVTIESAKIANCYMKSTGGTTSGMVGVVVASNGTYTTIEMNNVHISGYNSTFISDQSSQSGTGNVLITNSFADGGASSGGAGVQSAGNRSMKALVSNTYHASCVGGHFMQVYGGSGKTFDFTLSGIKASNKILNAGGATSHTFNVRMSGVSSDNFTLTGGNMVNSFGTTCTWNFYGNCSDMGLDIANIAGQVGTTIYNTNTATAPGAGLVSYDGSWKRVATRTQALVSGAAPAVDCNLGNNITLATGANATVTLGAPSNIPAAGERVTFTITQDATGGRTIAWNAAYIFPTAWSNTGNTSNKKSSITFVSDGTALVAQGANSWY